MLNRIGSTVTFGTSGNSEDFLLYGWHFQERGFTWATGAESAILLPLIAAPYGFFIELHLQPFTTADGPQSQRLEIEVNGTSVGKTVLTRETLLAYYVPPLNWQSRRIVIRLKHPDAYTYPEGDVSLALAFTRVRCLVLQEPYENPCTRALSSDHALANDKPDEDAPRRLAMEFVSLGANCEFGFTQRQMGAEPLDLFRFAGIPPIRLLYGIDCGFEHLDDPGNLMALDQHIWDIRDRTYHLTYHTFLDSDQISWDKMVVRESRRLRFLADKFMSDLVAAEKTFVWWQSTTSKEEEILPLYLAMRRHGPNRLLWVEPGDPSGPLREIYPGLLRGNIEALSPPGHHNMPNMFHMWLPLLRSVAASIDQPAPEVSAAAAGTIPAPPGVKTRNPAGGRIVFLGNCQAHLLSVAYNAFASDDQNARFVDWRHVSDEDKQIIGDAGKIVLQVSDLCTGVPDYIPASAEVTLFPYVSGGFLWPYATEPHIHFVGSEMGRAGAFGEMGDAFLNRMLRDGVDTEIAVERYLSLDIVKVTNLDRRLELALDRQRRRDEAAGIGIAPFLESHLRQTQLFFARGHLATPLARFTTDQVFKALGVSDDRRSRLYRPSFHEFFERNEQPIHPKIVSHLGLPYGNSGHLFRLNHGRSSFEDYCRSYMRQSFNGAIYEGLRRLRDDDIRQAIDHLEAGLGTCPDSVNGWLGLSSAFLRGGDPHRAMQAIDAALKIDPADVRAWSALTELHIRSQKFDDADVTVQRMLELEPGHLHGEHLAKVIEARRSTLGSTRKMHAHVG